MPKDKSSPPTPEQILARDQILLGEIAHRAFLLSPAARAAALDGAERAGLDFLSSRPSQEGLVAWAARAEPSSPGSVAEAIARGAPSRGPLMRSSSASDPMDPMAALSLEGSPAAILALGASGGDLQARGPRGECLLALAADGAAKGARDRLRSLLSLRPWPREDLLEAISVLAQIGPRDGVGPSERWGMIRDIVGHGGSDLLWEPLPKRESDIRAPRSNAPAVKSAADMALLDLDEGFWRGLSTAETLLGEDAAVAKSRATRLLEGALRALAGKPKNPPGQNAIRAIAGGVPVLERLRSIAGPGEWLSLRRQAWIGIGGRILEESKNYCFGEGGAAQAQAIEWALSLGAPDGTPAPGALLGEKLLQALGDSARIPSRSALSEIPALLGALRSAGAGESMPPSERASLCVGLASLLSLSDRSGISERRSKTSGTLAESFLVDWACDLALGLDDAHRSLIGPALANRIGPMADRLGGKIPKGELAPISTALGRLSQAGVDISCPILALRALGHEGAFAAAASETFGIDASALPVSESAPRRPSRRI